MGDRDWRTLPLEAFVALQRGFDLSNNRREPGDVPVVGASGVIGSHSKAMANGPGVTLGRAGAMGVASYIAEDYWPLNTTLFVKDFFGNDPKFVYYLFKSMDFTPYNSGGVQPMLNRNYIAGLPLVVPEAIEQRAIAEVLGALDDKIALNERIASTARSLCRVSMEAIWRCGRVGSLTDSGAALSQGWRRTTLGQLCAAGGGAIQTGPFGSQLHASDYVESGIPSVMPQNIGDNVISEDGIARITSADAQRLSKYLLSEGDIVYSRRGDVKRRALVRTHEAGWLCGTGCLRVRVGTATSPLFVSYYLGEPEIQDWIAQHAVGATMPNLNTSILGEVPVVLPPSQVLDGIRERLATLDASVAHVMNENRTLAELRDTLLPQLVTGKLRVKDAIHAVEEAV
ncbi:restriction endonuclease subunit S [Streptomyces sp. SYSU K217416]